MNRIIQAALVAIALLLAPTIVPVPTVGLAGIELQTDQAQAACGAHCQEQCEDAVKRGVFMTIPACVTHWSELNAKAHGGSQNALAQAAPAQPNIGGRKSGQKYR